MELVKRMLFLYQEKHGKRPRILICAPSNNAVDEIAYRLYKASSAATPSNKFQSMYCLKIVSNTSPIHLTMKTFIVVVRIGVHASMNSSIHKISLESLANELINRNALKRDSPESSNLRTLTAEAKKLSKTKSILIASIEDANKVKLSVDVKLPYFYVLNQIFNRGQVQMRLACMGENWKSWNHELNRLAIQSVNAPKLTSSFFILTKNVTRRNWK